MTDAGGLPISFASIQSLKTSRGITANEEGIFSMVYDKDDNYFLATSIGYKSQRFSLDSKKSLNLIFLDQKNNELEEIVIMPDSMLYNVLKAAYTAISQNYFIRPFSMNAYYSERDFSEDRDLLYLAESTIRVLQNGYNKTNDEGQVEILKSRIIKNPEKDKTDNVFYYGGAFISTKNDPVKVRAEYLNPKNFNRSYSYFLEKIEKTGEDTLYVIKFNSNDKKERNKGRIWIDKRTKGYFFIETNTVYSKEPLSLSKIEHKTNERKFKYRKIRNTWFLESIMIDGTNYNKDRKTVLNYKQSFFCTSVDTLTQRPIDYNSRLKYEDILLETKINFDKDYFENSAVFEKDSLVERQITEFAKIKDSGSSKSQILKVLSKLSYQYALGAALNPKTTPSDNVSVLNLTIDRSEFQILPKVSPLFLYSIGYELSKNNEVYFKEGLGLFLERNSLQMRSIGFRQNYIISPRYLTHFVYGFIELGRIRRLNFVKEVTNSEILLNSYKPRGNHSKMYLKTDNFVCNLGGGYGLKKFNKLYYVNLTAYQSLHQKNAIVLSESSNHIFKRKTALNIENKSTIENIKQSFYFEIGIKRYF